MAEKFDGIYQSLSLDGDLVTVEPADCLGITNEEVAWAIACVRALDEIKARGGNPEATGTA